MVPFQLCKFNKPLELLEDHFDIKFVDFDLLPSIHAHSVPPLPSTCPDAGSNFSLTKCQAFGPPSPSIPKMIQCILVVLEMHCTSY